MKRSVRANLLLTLTALIWGAAFVAQDLSLIHISEPTRQAEISYAVFCLKKKNKKQRY